MKNKMLGNLIGDTSKVIIIFALVTLFAITSSDIKNYMEDNDKDFKYIEFIIISGLTIIFSIMRNLLESSSASKKTKFFLGAFVLVFALTLAHYYLFYLLISGNISDTSWRIQSYINLISVPSSENDALGKTIFIWIISILFINILLSPSLEKIKCHLINKYNNIGGSP